MDPDDKTAQGTENRKDQEKVKGLSGEEQELYYSMFENSCAIKLIIDPSDGRILDANSAAAHFYGYSREKLKSMFIREINTLPPDVVMDKMAEVSGHSTRLFYFMHRVADGRIRDVEVYSSILKVGGRQVLHSIIHDITERKRAEEALRRSERHASALVSAIPDMIFSMNADGVFLSYKAAREDLYLLPEQFIGRNVMHVLPSWLAVCVREKIKETIATREVQTFDYELEIPGRGLQHFECRMVFENEEEVIAIVRNITDFRRLLTMQEESRKKLEKSESNLREMNATKDKFFSIIAHDLKSPMSGILGLTMLLKDEGRYLDIDTITQYATLIHSTVQNTCNLLDNLLSWARLQQGRIPFNPVQLCISDQIRKVFREVEYISVPKNIELINEQTDPLSIRADENMIHALLQNLVVNAIKFTPKNGQVTISAWRTGSEMSISVKDSGIGMDPHTIENLFRIETSFTTRGTENEKGTGLGLLLCKEFVDRHNGRIHVESERGKGSAFIFTIPFSAETEHAQLKGTE